MDFKLSEEQLMIRDTAESFLADKSDSAAVRAAMLSDCGYDTALWQSLCDEMYWHAICIPEEYGGLGLGPVELAVVMEQMGRRLLCSPYFATVGLGVNALLLAGNEAQRNQWLANILQGQTATLAYNGGGRDWSLDAITATYRPTDGGFELDGEYKYVVDAHTADCLILAAREPESSGEDGISLFVLPGDTPGLQRQSTPGMDQTRKLGRISVQNVKVQADALLGEAGCAAETLRSILDLGLIALAAEQCGGAHAILEQAVDYCLEREQFGRSVAGFQAIKHKAADMKLKAEVSRSAVYYAACVAQEVLAGEGGDAQVASELAEAASMAKAQCSDTYFYNAGSALQMHGGVGFTWEYDVHLYFKRARASENQFGDAVWHRERLAQMLLDSPIALEGIA